MAYIELLGHTKILSKILEMKKISIGLLCAILSVVLWYGCSNNTQTTNTIYTKDTLLIAVDSSLKVAINEHKKAFENSHTNLILELANMQETDIVAQLTANKINCAVIQRHLTQNEIDYITQKEGLPPKEYIVAYNALALLTNAENTVENISIREITQYFNQNTTNFNLVFESSKCQAIQYIKNYFNLSNLQLSKSYTKNNFNHLIAYIKQDKQAIAIVPYSYIADIENPKTKELLNGIKILNVNYQDSTDKLLSISPSQESITTKEYPFIMPVILVEANLDLKSGTTFVNYIVRDNAQRLFLKLGLTPATFPGREIIIK